MNDTQPAYLVAGDNGKFYVVRGDEAREITLDTYEFANMMCDLPADTMKALGAAIDAAPAHTDSFSTRYEAARALLEYGDEQRFHDEATYCAKMGELLAIGKANIEAKRAGREQG